MKSEQQTLMAVGTKAANLSVFAEQLYWQLIEQAKATAYYNGHSEAQTSPKYYNRPYWWDYLTDIGRDLVTQGEKLFGEVQK